MMGYVPSPRVLIFDVNETLLDIESVRPFFADVFADGQVMREWFAQLLLYSMTATLAGAYVDFFTLARGVLHMVARSAAWRFPSAIGISSPPRFARCRPTPTPPRAWPSCATVATDW